MLHVWLPQDARDGLRLLRRPGLTALERALAASIVASELKRVIARGHVDDHWLSLVRGEFQRAVDDLVYEDALKPEDDG